jgi:hypothetical protein
MALLDLLTQLQIKAVAAVAVVLMLLVELQQ